MTIAPAPRRPVEEPVAGSRFRLNRAGILNVWQYDNQVFDFAGGRLLLRGANGAGKSKTLEMLLPFALDGDKAKITASAKHHTSLLWLMTDGYDGQARQGYIWVEFLRAGADGTPVAFTCGVGIRSSASGATATAWYFATDGRVGIDFSLEDEAGPLSRPRLEAMLGPERVFEKATAYKEYVGRELFGLDRTAYDEVLRLLYWLRQPQVGEDIEPAKLARQLSGALPQLDEQTVRTAGDAFDELTAFGEQIDRRAAAAGAIATLASSYGDYARAVVADRARSLTEALSVERRIRSEIRETAEEVASVEAELAQAESDVEAAKESQRRERARLTSYEADPAFRDQRELSRLSDAADKAETSAQGAESARQRSTTALERRRGKEDGRRASAGAGLSRFAERLRALDRTQREWVPGSGVAVPAILGTARLESDAQVPALEAALEHCAASLSNAGAAVSRRLAGVALVRDALATAEKAETTRATAEDQAEREEQRWEKARAARREAERAAEQAAVELRAALVDWASTADAPGGVVLPEELTTETVAGLPELAGRAAAVDLSRWHREQAQAEERQRSAEAAIERLGADRARVATERDPAPRAPALARTPRADGAALWQVVDFQEALTAQERAALEAALQSSGILDAWLRPGGRLLGPDDRDVVITPDGGTRDSGQKGSVGLERWLRVDLPADSDLTEEDVHRALRLVSAGHAVGSATWVDTDGAWRLGPTEGRVDKEMAQFIGASARAAERARRLAEIDEAISEQEAVQVEAAEQASIAATTLAGLNTWVQQVPSGTDLQREWTTLATRLETEAEAESANGEAQHHAQAARRAATAAHERLAHTAQTQALPADQPSLDATEQALRGLAGDLRDAERIDALRRDLTLWTEALAETTEAAESAQEAVEAAEHACSDAASARSAYEALKNSVGDSVAELEAKIAAARQALAIQDAAESGADERMKDALDRRGSARARLTGSTNRLAEHLALRTKLLGSLVAVVAVPGLIEAAGATDHASTIAGLDGHPENEPLPRKVHGPVNALVALSSDAPDGPLSALWRAYRDAASSAAADLQPAVTDHPGGEAGTLHAVSGRDEAGEAPILELATRVRAGVDRDRLLLTDREKKQFEQHILGELGEAIRACRHEAEELVRAMNDQLGGVTTSQGIRVRLTWKLRGDVPGEVKRAVELLTQPVGALLPEERATLRDVLHRLIEASRAEQPELSYSEHLAAALDYRTWSEFEIRYTRPEREGIWDRLHARSALSQGEQKVLCYLPLFAAAAAHFTSLAGAAPYAPRLVLLDDAFPKIDIRTHPLLFGLLVQLDLDFVITSERLWGDHDTVPELAIYEALRDPGQRGIAQYAYRWDGRTLKSIG